MLTPQITSKFVTKILTDKAGDTYRVVFLVALVGGKVQAQVVSAELIASASAAVSASPEILSLPAAVRKAVAEFAYAPSFGGIISPLSTFEFFMSQPTRAPSWK
ncbi:MAG: hypothetical protein JWO73_61 [Candidatus Taylorbacteria bacterium]|nr:hypothetical protein [Candidatus Taylorbacteria bacterium]